MQKLFSFFQEGQSRISTVTDKNARKNLISQFEYFTILYTDMIKLTEEMSTACGKLQPKEVLTVKHIRKKIIVI